MYELKMGDLKGCLGAALNCLHSRPVSFSIVWLRSFPVPFYPTLGMHVLQRVRALDGLASSGQEISISRVPGEG